MPTTCNITFDNNHAAVYYSGQQIVGRVELNTTSEKTIRGIRIEMNGKARVRYEKEEHANEGKNKKLRNITHTATDKYLQSRMYVLGGDDGTEITLPPGHYLYTFQFLLPGELPSSFEGEFGHIRYEIKVTIDRPWKFDNEFEEPFTVISALNLNTMDTVKIPRAEEDSNELYSCCWKSGDKTFARLIVPYTGFAPGQKIPFTLLVKNESKTDIVDSKVYLKKSVQFQSKSPKIDFKYEKHRIGERSFGKVLRRSNKEFQNFVQLPALPPSTMDTCEIINIRYSIIAEVELPGMHFNMELEIPIIIGTLPLIESVTNGDLVKPISQSEPKSFDGDKPPGFDTIVPPGYENAIMSKPFNYIDDDNKYIQRKDFVPKFPVFYNYVAPTAPSMPWIDDPRSSRIIPF